MFNVIVKNIFDKHAPTINKRTKSRPCAWNTDELKKFMNKRDRVLKKARKSTKQELRNQCNNMQKKAKATYHINLLNENRFHPKNVWKCVKNIFPTKSTNQNNISNNKKKNKTRAENFREYFSTVVSKLKAGAFKLNDCVWKPTKSIPNRTKSVFKFQCVCIVYKKLSE